jgi:hypothetical protein
MYLRSRLVSPFNLSQATSGSLAGGISQPVVLAKKTKVVAHLAAGGFHVDATVDGVALRGIFVPSVLLSRTTLCVPVC